MQYKYDSVTSYPILQTTIEQQENTPPSLKKTPQLSKHTHSRLKTALLHQTSSRCRAGNFVHEQANMAKQAQDGVKQAPARGDLSMQRQVARKQKECAIPALNTEARKMAASGVLHHPVLVLLCLLVRARSCLLGIWKMFGASVQF